EDLPPAITVGEALSDLPWINEHVTNPDVIRRRKVSKLLPYREPKDGLSAYARLMRGWAGVRTEASANGHLVRLTPRDFPIFAAMTPGADYPQARQLAEEMFLNALAEHGLSARSRGSAFYADLRARM